MKGRFSVHPMLKILVGAGMMLGCMTAGHLFAQTPSIVLQKSLMGGVQDLGFDPSGRLLALTDGAEVHVWDLASNKRILSVPGGMIAFGGDSLILARNNRWYDIRKGTFVPVVLDIPEQLSPGDLRVASRSGNTLALADYSTLAIIDGVTGARRTAIDLERVSGPRLLAVAPTGDRIALARDDSTIVLCDTAVDGWRSTIRGYPSTMAFAQDGKALVVVDDSITTYRLPAMTIVRREPAPPSGRLNVLSDEGTRLAASIVPSDGPAFLRISDLGSGRSTLHRIESISAVAFSPEDSLVACGGANGKAIVLPMRSRPRYRVQGTIYPDAIESIGLVRRNGLLVAASGGIGTHLCRFWNLADGREADSLSQLLTPLSSIESEGMFVASSTDSSILAVLRYDRIETSNGASGWQTQHSEAIDLSDVRNGRLLRSIIFSGTGRALALSDDGAMVAAIVDSVDSYWRESKRETSIIVWDVGSGTEIARRRCGEEYFRALEFTPDSMIVAVSHDTIIEWNPRSNVDRIIGTDGGAWVLLLPGGERIAVGKSTLLDGFDGTPPVAAHVIDRRSGRVLQSFTGPPSGWRGGLTVSRSGVTAFALDPSGTLLAGGGIDSTLTVWDVSTGETVATLHHRFGIITAALFIDAHTMILGTESGGMYRWSVREPTPQAFLRPRTDRFPRFLGGSILPILSAAASSTGEIISMRGGEMEVWRFPMLLGRTDSTTLSMATRTRLGGADSITNITTFTTSADGSVVAARTNWGKLLIWRRNDGGPPKEILLDSGRYGAFIGGGLDPFAPLGGFQDIALDPTGRVVACLQDSLINFYDTRSGALTRTIRERQPVHTVVWSPDGTWLATALSNTLGVQLWSVGANEVRRSHVIAAPMEHVVFSGSGRLIAILNREGTQVFTTRTGRPVASRLATGSTTWNVIAGAATDAPTSAVFNADESLLIIGRYDGSIATLDLRRPTAKRTTRPTIPGAAGDVAVSPDGTLVATTPRRTAPVSLDRVEKTPITIYRASNGAKVRSVSVQDVGTGFHFTPTNDLVVDGSSSMTLIPPSGSVERFEFWSRSDVGESEIYLQGEWSSDGFTAWGATPPSMDSARIPWTIRSFHSRTDTLGRPLPLEDAFNEDINLHVDAALGIAVGMERSSDWRPTALSVWTLETGKRAWSVPLMNIDEVEFFLDGERRQLWLMASVANRAERNEGGEYGLSAYSVQSWGIEGTQRSSSRFESLRTPIVEWERGVVICFRRGRINIVDLRSGEVRHLIDHEGSEVSIACLNSSGELIAVTTGEEFSFGGGKRELAIWEVASGRKVVTIDSVRGAASLTFVDGDSSILCQFDDGTFRTYGIGRDGRNREFDGHEARVVAVRRLGDRWFVSAGLDGTFRFWDSKSLKEKAMMIPVGGSDYILLDKEGNYTASRHGLDGVGFKIGSNGYSFDQFDLRLNRPDKVLASFDVDRAVIDTYHDAYLQRLDRMHLTEETVARNTRLPSIELLGDLPIETDQPSVQLQVRAWDDAMPLERLNVYVNNVPVHGVRGIPLETGATAVDTILTVRLTPGDNRIQISVLNQGGGESIRATSDVAYLSPMVMESKPALHLIAVGVSDYENPKRKLRFADKDARALADAFVEHAMNYASVDTVTLVNEHATRSNILALRERLMRSAENDIVILSFSGHGLLADSSRFYFGTVDVDFDHPKDKGVSYEEIESLLDGIPARRKLLLLDACHSGDIDRPGKISGSVLGAKGVDILERATSNQLPLGIASEIFADLQRVTGAHVISAAGRNDYALESPSLGNGAFTRAVIDGLHGAASRDSEGRLTVSALRSYVFDAVVKMTGNQQRPTSRRENIEFDFDLFGQ